MEPKTPSSTESVRPVGESLNQVFSRWSQAKRQTDAEMSREELGRARARSLQRIAADLGPRYAPTRANLARFVRYHAAQDQALKRLGDFCGQLRGRTEAGEGLVLYGAVGTGKDHLLAALLYQAADHGFFCRWFSGQDLYGRVRDRMDEGLAEDGLLRELTEPAVLAVSDPTPPAGPLSNFRLEFLGRLIDRRYRALKPTWMTLNALDAADAEAKLSSPVWDRLQESAELVPCFWPSYRERKRP